MKTKIRFEFYNEVLDRDEVETIWADVIDQDKGFYKLDNIPFFVKSFAAADIVKANKIDEGFPKVVGLIEESGNSTINIIFLDKDDEVFKNKVLKRLNDLGVEYEGLESVIKGYYSLNVPKDIDYNLVFDFLTEESEGLDFREACIGHPMNRNK